MKRVSTLICLLLLPLFTGCLGGVPLDKYCYVLDVGVERGDTLPFRFVFLLNEDTGSRFLGEKDIPALTYGSACEWTVIGNWLFGDAAC